MRITAAGVPQRGPRRSHPGYRAGTVHRGELAAGSAGVTTIAALLAVVRRWRALAVLAAGETVTEDGCAIGLDLLTGTLVGFGWADAERGVLLAGAGPLPAQAVACAAMRRRKSIIVADLDGGAAACSQLAGWLGVPVAGASGPGEAVAAAAVRAIRARSVLLASGGARPLLDDVAGVLAWLRERGLRADCLLWVSGCEAAEPGQLAELLALGPTTGTAVLLSTSSAACAAELARHSGLTVVCSATLAGRVIPIGTPGPAADAVARQPRGAFTMIGPDQVLANCRAVPINAAGLSMAGRR